MLLHNVGRWAVRLPAVAALLLFAACRDPVKSASAGKRAAATPASVVSSAQGRTRQSSLPRVDLLALRDSSDTPPLRTVTIPLAPAYKKSLRVQGYTLRDALARIPGWSGYLQRVQTSAPGDDAVELIFRCRDGYAPTMPLRLALARHGYLALRDVDAPAGEEWLPFQHGNKTETPAPFYLVWEDVSAEDFRYSPYQVISIEIVDWAVEYRNALPAADAMADFHVARVHCLQCHSVNLVGGTMGPELNIPKNILEYWREEDLRSFVIKPSTYRARVAMPANPHLTPADLDAVVRYLRAMQQLKRPPVADRKPG